ncbi:MAG: peptidylprolyl isomerase [Bacteroidales bacterium]|nr:peptidylprolyl isomerase [Bacteroidales bacterium]
MSAGDDWRRRAPVDLHSLCAMTRLPDALGCFLLIRDFTMTFHFCFQTQASSARSVRISARLAALCAVAFLAATGPSRGETPVADPLIARVDDVEIRQSDLALAEEHLGKMVPAQDDAKRDYLVTYLSDMILLARAAQSRNVGDEADLQRRMAFVRNRALMDKLLLVTGEGAVTEDVVRKAYDEVIRTVQPEPELRLRGILFRFSDVKNEADVKAAEAKAKAALKRIAKGEDFAAVAKALTDSASGKENGGDLGFMTRAQMGQEFADAAFKLEKGAVSAPIKTQFGWHVIKVEEQRVREPMTFDAVRDKLEVVVARKAQIDLINTLRAEARIERVDLAEKAEKPEKPAEPTKQ